MVQLVLAVVCLLGVIFLPGFLARTVKQRTMGQKDGKGVAWTARVVCSLLALFMILSSEKGQLTFLPALICRPIVTNVTNVTGIHILFTRPLK